LRFFNILTIYLITFVLGIAAYYLQEAKIVNHIWDYWGVIDTSSAVALALLAAVAYWEYIKGEDKIKIYFLVDGKKVDTKLSLLRKDFSRSELMGVLGMIQKDQDKRFKISYFQNPAILEDIQKIQKGDGDEFIIELKQEEFEKFNLSAR